MKHLLLIGPPGSGKSTLIVLARSRGLRAEDLEEYGHGSTGYEERLAKARELAQETEDGVILVGMADVDPMEFPMSAVKVMLLPSWSVYEKRLHERDANAPHKQGQEGLERKYDVFKQWSGQFDHVVVNDGLPDETLDSILSLLD